MRLPAGQLQHDARLIEPLELRRPPVYRRLQALFSRQPGETRVLVGDDPVVRIEGESGISDLGTQLRFAGRRYRLARPADQGFVEGLINGFRGRRRRVWKVGSGVATEIRETSVSRKELSGYFTIDGAAYQVTRACEGLLRARYDGRVFADGGVLAELEPVPIPATQMTLTPLRPTRLDVLALALHMMIWLESAASGGGGGGAGGGGGGGGGC